jgi:hypothetical protein
LSRSRTVSVSSRQREKVGDTVLIVKGFLKEYDLEEKTGRRKTKSCERFESRR